MTTRRRLIDTRSQRAMRPHHSTVGVTSGVFSARRCVSTLASHPQASIVKRKGHVMSHDDADARLDLTDLPPSLKPGDFGKPTLIMNVHPYVSVGPPTRP